jgi:inner membrane protein
VDSVTHAFAVSLPLLALGSISLIPFAVLGAVIPDIDILFELMPENNPSGYIFTHGGITHSLVGAVGVSIVAFILVMGLSRLDMVQEKFPFTISSSIFCVILAGAILHVFLDYLAYPGIPLLYPFSIEKYTAGIFPGPSPFLLVMSIILLSLFILNKAGKAYVWAYIAIFIGFILLSGGLKVYVTLQTSGEAVPGLNPARWLIIQENDSEYSVMEYNLFHGVTNKKIFEKYSNITPEEVFLYREIPEIQRLCYHSYIITVEKDTSRITFRDPLRETGRIMYPMKYATYSMNLST